jgi:PAS domain S-box-containing protein
MVLTDPEGRFIRVNSAFARMLGCTVDEFTGRNVLDFAHPDDVETPWSEIEAVKAGRQQSLITQGRYVRSDGTTVCTHIGLSAVRDDDGAVLYFVAQVEDITERIRLEAELRQAQKMETIGRLASGVAHDFNNLLLAIRGYGELALRKLGSGEPGVVEDMDEVLGAARRAERLTKQLLAFSRRQVPNLEVLDLRDVVGEMATLLRPLIGEDVELAVVTCDEPVLVKADDAEMEQIIANLAVNARDAMPDGGRLSIEVSISDIDGPCARVDVTDSGIGMDARIATQIFDPFFTTKGEGGTGLGLATVQRIVALSGGHITVATEPGSGSTFSIVLPLEEGSPAALKTPNPDSHGGSETILVIDDEPTVRSLVSRMLADRGFNVAAAGGAANAIENAVQSAGPIDLVLTDMVMPGLNGRDAVKLVHELRPDAKVLYMSGYAADVVSFAESSDYGTAFIQKPFDGEELARRVRELLDAQVG